MNAPPPHRIAFSARDGLRLSAAEWPGPPGRTPLLCLPGICRTTMDFAALAARHAPERRVVVLDYAGHGESARAPDARRYRPDSAIRDVLDTMAALHLHRVALVGTSFGGLMAMAVAALRPAALAAVALNDIGPEIGQPGRNMVVEFVSRDPAFASLEEAAVFLRGILPPLPVLDDAGWLALTDRTYARGEDGRWHPRWDTRIAQNAVGEDAGELPDLWAFFGALSHVPLLLVWGQESELLSADTVARMRRMRPHMRIVSLPGTGHAPTLDEPEAVAALDAFLRAVP